MKTTTLLRAPSLVLTCALGCLLAACATPSENGTPPTPTTGGPLQTSPPTPWTASFDTAAIVVADEVRIEGPRGLLDHVATRSEPEYHDYVAETRPEGFRQVFTTKDPSAAVEVTAFLDAWRLVALRRLVVLERPGDVDVRVEAIGDVLWRDATTGEEKRASALTWTGTPPE